jgi:protein ImuB
MQQRYLTIWFPHLMMDWIIIKNPALKDKALVIVVPDHGRLMITEPSVTAVKKGIFKGMIAADGRIIDPELKLIDEQPGLSQKLLQSLCKWCIRFTPVVSIDEPNGLILDATGCTHLWQNEENYFNAITSRLQQHGYHIRAAMADTIGAAWAVTYYGKSNSIVENGQQKNILLSLPPSALRINISIAERLHKLGLTTIQHFISMPRSALRRRFGDELLLRLDQALGNEEEFIEPLIPPEPFSERLHCLEPIVTKAGMEIALQKLLDTLCLRLKKEGKGLSTAIFRCFRLDGKVEQISIGTNHPSNTPNHLFKLFEEKIETIEPDLGIELFILEAPRTERVVSIQQSILNSEGNLNDPKIAELLDRITNKLGTGIIHRYLPDEHHWPERSIKEANSLKEKPAIGWRTDKLRPIHLLPTPHLIQVTAPIPDYPPMNFRYKGKLHIIKKADGPERIEREWWIENGRHRDYYSVEDEEGKRYWLFRSGHYDHGKPNWYLHGFFA